MTMGWSYNGPLNPVDVVGCDTCACAQTKRCLSTQPRHPARTEGCGMCDAAATGICPGHGIGAAGMLDSFMAGMSEEQRVDFAVTRAFIDAKLAKMPADAVVSIRINEYLESLPDDHGESMVNVSRVRGKAHWNLAG